MKLSLCQLHNLGELTVVGLHDIFCAMPEQIYSLKMRAARHEKHISGGERLLTFPELEKAASDMLSRALTHPRGRAEKINLSLVTVEPEKITKSSFLRLTTATVDSWQQGRQLAKSLLSATGVSVSVISRSIAQLAAGPSSTGGVMRGAMLIDAETGERLETDHDRGVRVSCMDVEFSAQHKVQAFLAQHGLENTQVLEAWVLASKVAFYPEIVAELCWSDDPDYVTGYVASAQNGYQRITHLKALGDEIGGRIFFVKSGSNLTRLVDRLQHEALLFGLSQMECL